MAPTKKHEERDMSPEAIKQRLEHLEQLYELGESLQRARILGRVEDAEDAPGEPSAAPASPPLT